LDVPADLPVHLLRPRSEFHPFLVPGENGWWAVAPVDHHPADLAETFTVARSAGYAPIHTARLTDAEEFEFAGRLFIRLEKVRVADAQYI
jgi:hypothetical protein